MVKHVSNIIKEGVSVIKTSIDLVVKIYYESYWNVYEFGNIEVPIII
jgi:hypothetical protein